MGRSLLRRTLSLSDWQSKLDRCSFAVDAGCTLALGQVEVGVFDNYAPDFRSVASGAVLGQAKKFLPTAALSNNPRERFRLVAKTGGFVECREVKFSGLLDR